MKIGLKLTEVLQVVKYGLKAQKLIAQGIALGNVGKKQSRPERAKAFNIKAFALSIIFALGKIKR